MLDPRIVATSVSRFAEAADRDFADPAKNARIRVALGIGIPFAVGAMQEFMLRGSRHP
jgi:hypothetical protein